MEPPIAHNRPYAKLKSTKEQKIIRLMASMDDTDRPDWEKAGKSLCESIEETIVF